MAVATFSIHPDAQARMHMLRSTLDEQIVRRARVCKPDSTSEIVDSRSATNVPREDQLSQAP